MLKVKERIKWIDIAKTIGIILVIIGHTISTPLEFKKMLYCFHMPLFFFLSGINFNISKYNNAKEFLKAKFKSLIIPYFILYMLNYLFLIIKLFVANINQLNNISILYLIKKILGLFINIRNTDYSVGIWFITCLFIVYIFAYIIIKFLNKNKLIYWFTIVLLFILGFVYAKYVQIELPWAIDAALIATAFFLISYYFKDVLLKLRPRNIQFLLIIALIVLNIILMRFNVRTDMYEMVYGIWFIFLVNSFIGITYTILLSNSIQNNLLSMIGTRTLFIYGIHGILLIPFNKLFTILNVNNLLFSSLWTIFTLLLVMFLSLILYPIYQKVLDKIYKLIKI